MLYTVLISESHLEIGKGKVTDEQSRVISIDFEKLCLCCYKVTIGASALKKLFR